MTKFLLVICDTESKLVCKMLWIMSIFNQHLFHQISCMPILIDWQSDKWYLTSFGKLGFQIQNRIILSGFTKSNSFVKSDIWLNKWLLNLLTHQSLETYTHICFKVCCMSTWIQYQTSYVWFVYTWIKWNPLWKFHTILDQCTGSVRYSACLHVYCLLQCKRV